jgi:hypothetical protein
MFHNQTFHQVALATPSRPVVEATTLLQHDKEIAGPLCTLDSALFSFRLQRTDNHTRQNDEVQHRSAVFL